MKWTLKPTQQNIVRIFTNRKIHHAMTGLRIDKVELTYKDVVDMQELGASALLEYISHLSTRMG